MSALDAISNFFSKASENSGQQSQAPTQAQTPPTNSAAIPAPAQQGTTTPGNLGTQQLPGDPNGGFQKSDPAGTADVSKQQNQQSPSDILATLYQTKDTGEIDLNKPFFQIDPAQFQTQLDQLDFTKNIQAEKVQAALSGDAAALMEVMNTVARSAVAASADLTSQVSNKTAALAVEATRKQVLPESLKRQRTVDTLETEEAFKNPIVRTLAEDLTKRYQQQYPQATHGEIAQFVRQSLSEVSGALGGTSSPAPKTVSTQHRDPGSAWASFFGQDS